MIKCFEEYDLEKLGIVLDRVGQEGFQEVIYSKK